MLKKKLGIECVERRWAGEYELKSYFKVSSTLIIPEGCKKIGDYAFYNYSNLKKVVISKSVVEIGYRAFCNCIELEEVTISRGVKEIGYAAFEKCKRLEEVVIPKNVKIIRNYAFCECENATIILKKPERKFEFLGYLIFDSVRDVKEELGMFERRFEKIRKTLQTWWWNRLLKKAGRSRD